MPNSIQLNFFQGDLNWYFVNYGRQSGTDFISATPTPPGPRWRNMWTAPNLCWLMSEELETWYLLQLYDSEIFSDVIDFLETSNSFYIVTNQS